MRHRGGPVALALAALLAGGAAVVLAGTGSPPIASHVAGGMVPEALADGSRPGPVPQRVAAAVVEPMIGERRLRARPGSAEGCRTPLVGR